MLRAVLSVFLVVLLALACGAACGAGAPTLPAAADTVRLALVPAGPGDTLASMRGPAHGPWARTAAILAAGGLAALYVADEESASAAERQLDQGSWEVASDVGNVYGDGLVIGGLSAGAWAVGHLAGDARAAALGGDLCEGFLLSSAAVWAVKVPVNRTRPGGGGHSFPSGHTTVAFAVVPVLGHHLGWKAAAPAALLATATAMGRMEDGRHFFSDVVFGAALGLACGDLVAGEGFLPGGARVAAGPTSVGVSIPF